MKHVYKASIGLFVTAVFFGMAMSLLMTKSAHALPPRPVPTPTSPPVPTPSAKSEVGAYIEMRLENEVHTPELWSVVQWLDGEGNWHDVMGWRGYVDRGGDRWWVANEDFDTGPFRWVVYNEPEEESILGLSESFFLPSHEKENVMVDVSEIE